MPLKNLSIITFFLLLALRLTASGETLERTMVLSR